MTAVELGADICAFARTVVRRRGGVQLLAVESLDPAAFPGIEAFTSAVRHARKSLNLPRRCRAVVWGLPDGASRHSPAVKPLIAPLTGAGFRVERVISPCNALAALARLRTPRGEGATCWLAVNRSGVAIVVVRPGKQLYSHSFGWDSSVGSSGSQARLLQRYTLVAFLAPEIRRAMAVARENGTPVEAIVTCGNLPEIRSLTMPLIEELDVEVEALDSLEGLIVKPDATDRFIDVAASFRIACAGAIARPTRPWVDYSKRTTPAPWSFRRLAAAAAVILGVFVVGWGWWTTQQVPALSGSKGASSGQPAPKPAVAMKPTALPPASSPAASKPTATATPPAKSAAFPIAQKPVPPQAQTPAATKPTVTPSATTKPAVTPSAAPKPAATPSVATKPAATPPGSSATASRPTAIATAPARSTVPPITQKPVSSPAQTPTPPRPHEPSPTGTQTSATPSAPATRSAAGPPLPAPQTSSASPQKSAPPPKLAPPPQSAPPPSADANAAALSDAAKRAAANVPPLNSRTASPGTAATRTVPAPSTPPPASVPPSARPGALDSPPAADKPGADRGHPPPLPSDTRRPAEAKPTREPLKDPVPRVTAILVSSDRQMATVDDGRIISVGDAVGKRVVVGIDERGVVLREPSGVQIRVALGGRIVGVQRSER